ncbi:phosphoglucosamine mutase [Nannocystis bainbridge]|uniref:phosphoglucosamine mutase n=1 Tax=Nannocystis bainbridge TaxID=2995303 RepID=UPI0023EEA7AC|nr:phosphoglucosamine mutase [Nannocystis bainbridge]
MANERRLFGTDGIRGPAGVPPMTPDIALRLGMAVAAHFGRRGSIVIGKDTRLSGYMFETALAAGVCAIGAEVLLVGPLPTPGIAYITRSMRADAGVVISASHNQFADNGIKLFAADGFKLPDDVEAHLEQLMEPGAVDDRVARGRDIGRAARIDDAAGRYLTHLKQGFPSSLALDGLTIVVDCAHGAAYKVAPTVLRELGATVIPIGVTPDGVNINDACGAVHPQAMCRAVVESGADLGIALDGDADRVVFSDARGNVVDGDAILAMCAIDMHARGALRGDAVVATVMSNMGLARCLAGHGIGLVRTPVGDRYVVESMLQGAYNLGGEQSGHVVFLDHGTTGDGMVAALQVLAIMQRSGRPLADLAGVMTRYPQLLKAIPVARKVPLDLLPELGAAVRGAEAELGDDGRVLVRYSGTESSLRVMLEGPDLARLEQLAERIDEVARRELAAP